MYWYAPWVLLRSSMCFRVPNLFSKIPKIYNWSMDSGVHSVLPRWFRHWDNGWIPTLKLVWKCVTRPSILFICNTFCCWLILLSSLYIELALVCCTNPDNVHCFGIIFPNLNFVFASICAARPVHIQSDQYRSCQTTTRGRCCSIHPDGEQPKQRCGSEFAKWHDIYTPEECADEWRQNNADLKLLENCVTKCFIMFGIMFMTATGPENSPQSFDVYTVK